MNLPAGSRPAMQHISGRSVAPGATITQVTDTAGDSHFVISFGAGHRAFIVSMWPYTQGASINQVRSQRMHDLTNGFRSRALAAQTPYQKWPRGDMQEVFSQDGLIIETSGSATAGFFELMNLILWYSRVDGIAQRLITWQEYFARKKHNLSMEHSIVAAAGGGYTGEVNFNTGTVYNLKANTEYAITGMVVNADCGSVVYKGPDFGQTRVGIPGNSVNIEVTREFFVDMAKEYDLPFIPIFNSANGGASTIGVHMNQLAGTFIVNTNLAELR